MKKVTLADIAQKTGYSINTVSHALNNKPDISEKTKTYIHKTAKEMGYIVNLSAGALRSGKSKSIAVIVGDISNPHFSIMIKEMESRLREYGYTAIIFNTDEDEEIERSAIISAISKNVDGIIICPVQKTENNIKFLSETGVLYTLIGRRFENINSNYVICDDINGGYAAAQLLLEENHRNILFINGHSYISSAKERLEGIKKAFAEKNVPGSHLFVAEVSVMNDSDILDLLHENSDATAIICFSDLVAMQVCLLLRRLGKRVPEDVSVIGFDNIVSKFSFPVMLSSVTSSKTKMSVKAVDILINSIENGADEKQQIVLPTQVVIRETTKSV